MITVVKPKLTPAVAKRINKLMPIKISGMTIGIATKVWILRARLNR